MAAEGNGKATNGSGPASNDIAAATLASRARMGGYLGAVAV